MVDIDWNPDQKKLKQFGWISLVGFGVIGLVAGWKFGLFAQQKMTVPGVLWGIGILSAILAMVKPTFLKPLYYVLTAISAVIGPIVATVIMALIYYLVFLPLGLVFKMMGRDELHRTVDPDAKTYWAPEPEEQEPKRYFRQY